MLRLKRDLLHALQVTTEVAHLLRLVQLLTAGDVFLYFVELFHATRNLALVVFSIGLTDLLQLFVERWQHNLLSILSLVLRLFRLLLDANVLSHGSGLHVSADGLDGCLLLLFGYVGLCGLLVFLLGGCATLELFQRISVHVQVINLAELVLPAILTVELCEVTLLIRLAQVTAGFAARSAVRQVERVLTSGALHAGYKISNRVPSCTGIRTTANPLE